MINILCNADRTWQMKHFGYGFQTHSWADLVADPIERITKGFCQCRRLATNKYQRIYKVRGLSGCAAECKDPIDGIYCNECGNALFFSYKFTTLENISGKIR